MPDGAWQGVGWACFAHNPCSANKSSRELIPSDMLGDLERAKIVITNYYAFKLRERLEISEG